MSSTPAPLPAPRTNRSTAPAFAALLAVGVVGGAVASGVGGSSRTATYLILGIPAFGVLLLLLQRRPELALGGLAALTAFSGTLAVNFGFPIEGSVWVVAIAVIGSTAAGYLTRRRSRRMTVWPGIFALGAFVLFVIAHIPFAETFEIGWRAFMAGPFYLLLFFAVAYAPWGVLRRTEIVHLLTIVMLVAGAYALFRLVVGPTTAEASLARRSAAVNGDLALFGSFPNRVELGSWSAVAVPFLFAGVLAMKGRWRIISAVAFALMAVGLLGSQVRIALIAALVGIVVAVVLYQTSRAFTAAKLGTSVLAVVALGIIGVGAFAITVADSPDKVERFENILTPSQDFSYQRRIAKWDEAVDEINANPYGQGLGTAGSVQRNYSSTIRLDNFYIDNSYLQLGYQLGYPGLVLFGAAALLIFYMLCKSAIRATDPRVARLGIGAAAAFVTWLVHLMSSNIFETWGVTLVWLLAGLAAGSFVARPTASRRKPRPRAAYELVGSDSPSPSPTSA